MLVYTGVRQHPTRKAAESKRVDTGSKSATTIQMQASTENSGAMARLQVPNLREQQVHDLQDIAGVEVVSRTTKRQRKLWEILLTEKALGAEAVWEALVCRGSLTGFCSGPQRAPHGSLYWWCDASVQALHTVVQSCAQLGMTLCPSMVRTAKHGNKQAWLCNGAVWLQNPAAGEAVATLRHQGMAISASWEPHLLQLTSIPSKQLYFKSMACVPSGSTAHGKDEVAQLHSCEPHGEWSPAQPVLAADSAAGEATERPGTGCIMTPVLARRGVTWVVPAVPPGQLAALAVWLAEHRLNHLDVHQGNLRDAAAGTARPALRCGQKHKDYLAQAIGAGKWSEQGLGPDTNPGSLAGQQCAWCAGLHGKHVCPHGAISQMLKAHKAQTEVKALARVAMSQQTQRVSAALQPANPPHPPRMEEQHAAVKQFWDTIVRSPLQPATSQQAGATQRPEANPWQEVQGNKKQRRQRKAKREQQQETGRGEACTQSLPLGAAETPTPVAETGTSATPDRDESELPEHTARDDQSEPAMTRVEQARAGQNVGSTEQRTPTQAMAVDTTPPSTRANLSESVRPPMAPRTQRGPPLRTKFGGLRDSAYTTTVPGKPPRMPRRMPPRAAKTRANSALSEASSDSDDQ